MSDKAPRRSISIGRLAWLPVSGRTPAEVALSASSESLELRREKVDGRDESDWDGTHLDILR